MAKSKTQIPPLYVGIMMFSLGLLIATLLNSSQPGTSDKPQESNEGLFRLFDQNYDIKDLPYPQASAIFSLEQETYEQKVQQLEQAALTLHFDQLAAKDSKTREQIRTELADVEPISDDEVEKFYNINQAQITQPFHAIKDTLKQALNRDRMGRAEQRLIDDLMQKGLLQLHITPPVAPTVVLNLEGYPSKGPADASVLITEFADYRCPHCRAAAATLKQVQADHPQMVRLVMLDFPILGKLSKELAKAAYCANEQGKFWDYHDALFINQSDMTLAKAMSLAEEQGLNIEQLTSCIAAAASEQQVEKAVAQADQLGLTGTPAIFINGLAYRGNNQEDALRASIEAVLPAIPKG